MKNFLRKICSPIPQYEVYIDQKKIETHCIISFFFLFVRPSIYRATPHNCCKSLLCLDFALTPCIIKIALVKNLCINSSVNPKSPVLLNVSQKPPTNFEFHVLVVFSVYWIRSRVPWKIQATPISVSILMNM